MSSTDQGITPPAQPRGANPALEQWRVTIQRVRPQLVGLLVFVAGLVVGLIWAYGIAPTIWTNAEPIHLHVSYQDEWVKMVADQYSMYGQSGQQHARNMLSKVGNAQTIIDRLVTANRNDPELVGRLNAIRQFAPGAENPELLKLDYNLFQTMNPIVLVAIVLIVGALGIILWGMYAMAASMIVKGLLPSRRKAEPADSAMAEASRLEVERRRIAQEMSQQRQAEAVARPVQSAPPLKQFMSTYLLGDDYYDESFSIEDASGGFLGETGAGISETVSVGTPKKVTAIEVWLFDKNDIRTITKVIMSEHAFNDNALRAKLAPKGEAVLAVPGKPVVLETQTLRVVATIRNCQYGPDPTPAHNSYFENMTLDIAAYTKEGATSAPGTAIGDMYGDAATPL